MHTNITVFRWVSKVVADELCKLSGLIWEGISCKNVQSSSYSFRHRTVCSHSILPRRRRHGDSIAHVILRFNYSVLREALATVASIKRFAYSDGNEYEHQDSTKTRTKGWSFFLTTKRVFARIPVLLNFHVISTIIDLRDMADFPKSGHIFAFRTMSSKSPRETC